MTLNCKEDNNDINIITFTYSYKIFNNIDKTVSLDILIPLEEYQTIEELATHLCMRETIPYCYHDDVLQKMMKFIQINVEELEAKNDDKILLESFKNNSVEWNVIAKELDKYIKHCKSINSNVDANDKISFEDRFQFVIQHGSKDQLSLIIKKEAKMADEMGKLIRNRDEEVSCLKGMCEEQISQLTNNSEAANNDPYILTKLNEKLRSTNENYAYQIEELRDRQKNEFREMIKILYEIDEVPEKLIHDLSSLSITTPRKVSSINNINHPKTLEIFTVYLGAQLKSTHNVRIISCDNLSDLCLSTAKYNNEEDDSFFDSQRLNTLMHLYRRGQSAVMLLVDKDPLFHIHNRSTFFKICESSTELHFDCLEKQLEEVKDTIQKANDGRLDRKKFADEFDNENDKPKKVYDSNMLRSGDIYITRHSNLSQTQVVFHIVADNDLEFDDISSRHPILNGLRNCIRYGARYGVTTINIPLLLVNKPLENMTISWCLKRAELVFKCIKGYLMEICNTGSSSSTPGGSTSHNTTYTINFILPNNLSTTVYSQIIDLFPSIFHLVPSVTI
uniref:Macro domain-containing protein n=1 Tax=Parastrongyloides trichosuri TaxID=131310 RepID=A0A0N4ZQ80_PARTI